MDLVNLISTKQREFLELIKGMGDAQAAAGTLDISSMTLKDWLQDPDFSMAYHNACEAGKGLLMAKAVTGLHRNLDAGRIDAVKMTLQAFDPNTWNPIQKVQVEEVKHRFIGFNGRLLHEGGDTPEYPSLEQLKAEDADLAKDQDAEA